MKNKYLIAASLCLYLGAHAANDWFIQPEGGLVIPSPSGIVYHGMSGHVEYRDGYSAGLSAGRYVGSFKLYLSYDYTSFKAKGATLQTPLGQVTQGDSDLYHVHTVLLNANYTLPVSRRLTAFFGAGAGESFDSATNAVFEIRSGLSYRIHGLDISTAYGYRITQGQIKEGLKSDGSYSIMIDEPAQQRITVALSHRS